MWNLLVGKWVARCGIAALALVFVLTPAREAVAQGVVYTTPPIFNMSGVVIRPATIQELGVGPLVEGLGDTTGLAIDGAGNVYFGTVTYGPLRVELRKRSGAGIVTSLGTVIDTSGGWVSFSGFDLAADAQGRVFYSTPLITSMAGTVVRSGTIQELGVGPLVEGLGHTTGLAVDGDGNLYFGKLTYGPLRVELMKRSTNGTLASLGTVIDTSAGWVIFSGFHVAADAQGRVVYVTPPVTNVTGTVLQPGSIQELGVGPVVEGLGNISGLTVDAAGALYFGKLTYGPLRVELLKRSPDATLITFGTVIDTSAGWVSFRRFDVAATPATLDTTAPTITALTVDRPTLWPANHKMIPVNVAVAASDAVDPNPICRVERVSSSEASDSGGNGATAVDWTITGALAVSLRAERSGGAAGRAYLIEVSCSDASGNSATATTSVLVPHDRR